MEMKEGIHPEYNQTTITCACGNVLEVGSTKKDIKVDVCSKCHPYWTGLSELCHPQAVGLPESLVEPEQ